jgi:hypothetical protein
MAKSEECDRMGKSPKKGEIRGGIKETETSRFSKFQDTAPEGIGKCRLEAAREPGEKNAKIKCVRKERVI